MCLFPWDLERERVMEREWRLLLRGGGERLRRREREWDRDSLELERVLVYLDLLETEREISLDGDLLSSRGLECLLDREGTRERRLLSR